MRINEYFDSEEFACKCGCGCCVINDELVAILTAVREFFQAPVIINSGNRCTTHNRACGGSVRSQHRFFTAADIVVRGVDPDKVANYIENEFNPGGLGRYDTFTHVDVREGRARWNG